MSAFDHIAKVVIPAVYAGLPPHMKSPGATAMMLAIGLQESRFEHRRQIKGPARGFPQFEKGGGVVGVMHHKASRPWLLAVLESMSYPPDAAVIHEAMADNDILAMTMARLLLWTDPKPLPAPNDPQGGWDYYLRTWRPGRPHRESWDAFYKKSWETANEVLV